MTEEEKQLLLKDLCARLPYGVKVQFYLPNYQTNSFDEEIGEVFEIGGMFTHVHCKGIDYLPNTSRVKPYLRPMSNMTEEEIEEYRNLSDEVVGSYGPYHREFIAHCVRLGIKPDNPHECVDNFLNMEAIDWLNEHHFDYRNLIDKGLALEAPEGMYKDN